MNDLKWFQTPQAQKLSQAAEGKAWEAFFAKFTDADKSKFVTQTDFDDNRKAKAEIYFKEGGGLWEIVFGSDSKYWSLEMRNALGFKICRISASTDALPRSCASKKISTPIGETLNKTQEIYITPTDFFTTQYRQIFKDTQITFRTSKN